MDKTQANVMLNAKSAGMGVLLTLFFGCLGMLYCMPGGLIGGIIVFVIEMVLVIITIVTFGIGVIFLILWHVICVFLVMGAIKRHNQRLIDTLPE